MVKRVLLVLIAILFIASSVAYADSAVVDNINAKLHRGIQNTFLGWVELPYHMKKGIDEGFGGDENNKVAGIVTGTIKGALCATGRTISGLVDVLGFWALSPDDNEGIGLPLDSEVVWQEGTPYDLTDPSLEEAAFAPIGRKLLRGLTNGVFGVAEIPGQIAKGAREGAALEGIGKGIYNFFSRELSAAYDLATLISPTPKDAVGNHFDQEFPWTDLAENVKK